MPVEYRYNSNLRTIDISCIGELVIDEIMTYFDDLKADAAVPCEAVELVDISRVSHFNVDFLEAASMPSGYVGAYEAKAIRATILFGANPLNQGLAELIRAHFLNNLPEHTFHVVEGQGEARAMAARIHADRDAGAC
ncbi:hypothetical protein [Pelagicoccus sp. SDUM812003]|uniref:hypothetical protein n=1 Tax=Pelagicoccus sp. SDUM812003 TaxID=3041267 RepID=UPI00280C86BC|nr:hypothetical protein [Pelagicoccus sp. SDUM812003]MDQ8204895.1 hypothetical protein [Pelagicoccus sp. SDUM812003]